MVTGRLVCVAERALSLDWGTGGLEDAPITRGNSPTSSSLMFESLESWYMYPYDFF